MELRRKISLLVVRLRGSQRLVTCAPELWAMADSAQHGWKRSGSLATLLLAKQAGRCPLCLSACPRLRAAWAGARGPCEVSQVPSLPVCCGSPGNLRSWVPGLIPFLDLGAGGHLHSAGLWPVVRPEASRHSCGARSPHGPLSSVWFQCQVVPKRPFECRVALCLACVFVSFSCHWMDGGNQSDRLRPCPLSFTSQGRGHGA